MATEGKLIVDEVYSIERHNVGVTEDKTQTLTECEKTKEVPCVTYGLDRASFNQGKNAKYDFAVEEELSPTILSKGPGGVMTEQ